MWQNIFNKLSVSWSTQIIMIVIIIAAGGFLGNGSFVYKITQFSQQSDDVEIIITTPISHHR